MKLYHCSYIVQNSTDINAGSVMVFADTEAEARALALKEARKRFSPSLGYPEPSAVADEVPADMIRRAYDLLDTQ